MRSPSVLSLAPFLLAAVSPQNAADAKTDLFYIKRNKNRNEVHYVVRYNSATCQPIAKEPLFGYWQMLEKGPKATEAIGRFENMAYGIKSQEVKGSNLWVQLKAFPDRKIRIAFEPKNACKITPFIAINGKESVLSYISVFAEEGIIKPTVKYIDVVGTSHGVPVTERMYR